MPAIIKPVGYATALELHTYEEFSKWQFAQAALTIAMDCVTGRTLSDRQEKAFRLVQEHLVKAQRAY